MLLVELPFFDPCLNHAFTIVKLVHFLTIESSKLTLHGNHVPGGLSEQTRLIAVQSGISDR